MFDFSGPSAASARCTSCLRARHGRVGGRRRARAAEVAQRRLDRRLGAVRAGRSACVSESSVLPRRVIRASSSIASCELARAACWPACEACVEPVGARARCGRRRRRAAGSGAPPRSCRRAIWPEPVAAWPRPCVELRRRRPRPARGRGSARPVPRSEPLEAALQPRELAPARCDLAGEAAQHRGALEQRRRPEHRLDARLARDLRAGSASARRSRCLGRDRPVACGSRPRTASPSRRRGRARRPRSSCARRCPGGRFATFGGPVSSASAGRRQQQQREGREQHRDPRLARQRARTAAPTGSRARADHSCQRLTFVPEHREPRGDREQRGDAPPARRRRSRPASPTRAARPGAISSAPSIPTASAVPANTTVRPARATASSTASVDARARRPAPRGSARRSAASSRRRARARSS